MHRKCTALSYNTGSYLSVVGRFITTFITKINNAKG